MSYFGSADVAAALRGLFRDETPRLEREFADYVGVRHALGTSYGRTALYLGLRAVGVEGREVLLPAFVCTVVRHAVAAAGAIPRFVDIDPNTLEMDLEDLRRKVSSRAKAVLMIHYFGRAARTTEAVARLARDHGLLFVEDCAHSLGAMSKGRKIGASGDFSIFSLTKSTVNAGGGVLATDHAGIAGKASELLSRAVIDRRERIADFPMVFAYGLEQAIAKLYLDRIRRHRAALAKVPTAILGARASILRLLGGGRRVEPEPANAVVPGVAHNRPPWGYHLPMEPMVAALGRSQLGKIDALNLRRQRVARLLGLEPAANCAGEGRPAEDTHSFVVLRFRDRELGEVIRMAARKGLTLRSTWPTRQRLWDGQATPAVKQIGREICTWCVNPDLTDAEVVQLGEIVETLGARFLFAAATKEYAA